MTQKKYSSSKEINSSGLIPVTATAFLMLAFVFGFHFDDISARIKKVGVAHERVFLSLSVAIPTMFYKFIEHRISDKAQSITDKYEIKLEKRGIELEKEKMKLQAQSIENLQKEKERMSQEIEDKKHDLADKFKDQLKEKLQRWEEGIKSLVISEEEYKKLRSLFNDTSKTLENLGNLYLPSQEIVEWLDSPSNDYENANSIVSSVFEKVSQELDLEKECLPSFENNLRRCYDWLSYSIERINPYSIEPDSVEEFISALQKTSRGIEIYRFALDAFEYELLQVEVVGNTRLKQRIVSKAIEELRKEIERVVQERDLDAQKFSLAA